MIRWWTHGIVDPPITLLGVMLLVIVANTFWFTLTTALAATNRHTRMAIVYLMRTPRPAANRKVVLAEVREKWQEPGKEEQQTDLFGELETIVSNHLDLNRGCIS